jgi:hypothetical protein
VNFGSIEVEFQMRGNRQLISNFGSKLWGEHGCGYVSTTRLELRLMLKLKRHNFSRF